MNNLSSDFLVWVIFSVIFSIILLPVFGFSGYNFTYATVLGFFAAMLNEIKNKL